MKRKSITTKLGSLLILFSLITISNSQTEKRNQNEYETGPTFEDYDSRFSAIDKNGKPIDNLLEKQVRTYLWNIWSNKKLAYFKINTYTLEGKEIFCTYYVEKNKIDSWQVAIECDRENVCPYISKEKCQEYRYTKDVYDKVEKIDETNNKFKLFLYNSATKKIIKF